MAAYFSYSPKCFVMVLPIAIPSRTGTAFPIILPIVLKA
jgi:hypothetical protein